MLWLVGYAVIGAVVARRVATMWPRNAQQALGFIVLAAVWPLIAGWQIAERIDARIP